MLSKLGSGLWSSFSSLFLVSSFFFLSTLLSLIRSHVRDRIRISGELVQLGISIVSQEFVYRDPVQVC